MADQVAVRGRGGATGAGDASSAQPTTGEGGGQVGGSDGDIVVTARRSSTFGYVDYFPQATAALMSFDMQQGGAEYAAVRQQQRVSASLAQQIVDGTAPPSPLGAGAAERKFSYVGGPNDGDVSNGSFGSNPYFYNRDTQTIDYYELASGSTQAVLRTDPVRTQMLNDGLSELNWGIGGFLGSSIVGGATGAVGVALLGEGLLGGGVTAGFSGANANAVMRYSLGGENSLGSYTRDFGLSVAGYGAVRAVGALGSGIKITDVDGFLGRGFDIKAPFNINTQRFGAQMKIDGSDFWGLLLGTSQFANRTFVAIKPSWNDLSVYTTGVIPRGTPMRVGIVGPQGWRYPGGGGGAVQFIAPSNQITGQNTVLIKR